MAGKGIHSAGEPGAPAAPPGKAVEDGSGVGIPATQEGDPDGIQG